MTDPAGVQFLGAGALSTTIVGDGSDDVLNIDTAAAASLGGFGQLTNVTLSGGEGVSVNSSNGTLVMSGAGITGSRGAAEGGAVDDSGQFWATNSGFTDNTGVEDGGAIYNSEGSARLERGHVLEQHRRGRRGRLQQRWARLHRQLVVHLETRRRTTRAAPSMPMTRPP